jgi:hypothetical protein
MTTDNLQAINRVFDWFNGLSEPDAVVTREDVERLFTPDMKMIANNQVKCVGIEAHYKHFREIRGKLKSWKVRRPFEIAVNEGNRLAAYYLIEYVSADGKPGVIHDMAFWTFRDGKVESMVEVVHFDGSNVPLDNH